MDLPIDAAKAPFKAKYLDEETPMLARWIIFGEHPDGTVDVSDGTDDIFVNVPRGMAQAIVRARDAFVDAVLGQLAA